MPYDYDYFISYAHKDNVSEDGKPGFVDVFVEKLKSDSKDEQLKMFGREIKVFFDKSEIHNMSDWDNTIQSKLASSRFLIVLLSPGYFQSEYCAREFEWWMQHEMHRRMLGEGTAPMLIVAVEGVYDFNLETIPDIPDNLQARFPNWLSQIRKIQSGPKFDMHNLDRDKISEALDSLREEVRDKVRRQNSAENSPNTALYPQYNKNFVGRRENLRTLRKSLTEKAAESYAALTGLGGFGKTELALTYGHAFAWDYQLGRVFAKCENKTSLIEVLLTCGIAEMFGWEMPKGTEEQQITHLFNRLKNKRSEIVRQNDEKDVLATQGAHLLLILDNVNKLDLISRKNLAILPDYFHVIITTRENTHAFPYIHSESVERLSEDESVELLGNLRSFNTDLNEVEAARKIARLLAGFTLAIELTGSYLDQNKFISYQKQYELLDSNHAEAFQNMANETGDLTRHAAETVAAVLESTLSALSPNARSALDLTALMAPDTVALGWIPELLGLDEFDGGKVLKELTGYNLLTPLEDAPNIARMHRLVADTVLNEIEEESRKEITAKIRKKCNELLEKDVVFWCASKNSWNIAPVSEFCMMLAKQWTAETSEEEIDLGLTDMLNKSGKTLKSLGRTDAALAVFREFMRISNERASIYSSQGVLRDLGLALSALGEMDYMAGKMESAKEFHTQALTIRKSLAEKQPDNVKIQCDLADSYKFLGDIDCDKGNSKEAKANYSEMLNISEKFKNTQDNNVLRNLSASYDRLGRLEEAAGNASAARAWYEKLLTISKQLAQTSPENVDFQRNLSISYVLLGDLEFDAGNADAARSWYEKALEIRKTLADQMPENVQFQQDLSYSYVLLGDLELAAGNAAAARAWYEKGLAIDQQLAQTSPENVDFQQNLSISYGRLGLLEQAAGNAAAARVWYEKALEIRKHLAQKAPENVDFQGNLSTSYVLLGDLEKAAGNADAARSWYEKALEIYEKLAKAMPENVDAQRAPSVIYNRLGDLERDAGNAAAARAWYEKLLTISKQLAQTSPENVDFQRNLSISYERLGDLEFDAGNAAAARSWYEKGLEIAKQLAQTSPENVLFQQDLSISYERLGDLEQAAGNAATARAWYEKKLAIDQQLAQTSPGNVDFQRGLSVSYCNIGRLEEAAGNAAAARAWYEKSLEIDQRLADKMPENVQAQSDLRWTKNKLRSLESTPQTFPETNDTPESQTSEDGPEEDVQAQQDSAETQENHTQTKNQSWIARLFNKLFGKE